MNSKSINFTISLIGGVLVLMINLSKIPTGTEMGGIGLAFLAIICSFFVYLIFLAIGQSFWSFVSWNKDVVQYIIMCSSIISVYYTSWSICADNNHGLTREELIQAKNERNVRWLKLYNNIPEILSESELIYPDILVQDRDSIFIQHEITMLFQSNYSKIDSLTKLKIISLIDYNGYYFDEDTVATNLILKSIAKTIKVRLVIYSPTLNEFLSIVTFSKEYINEKGGIVVEPDGFILVGKKTHQAITIYKYYHYQYPEYQNEDMAFVYYFEHIRGNDYQGEKVYSGYLEKEGWESSREFKRRKTIRGELFNFELTNYVNTDTFEFGTPILESKF